MSVINSFFVVLLLVAGTLLLVRPRRGVKWSLWVMWGEIAYYLIQVLITMPSGESHGPWRDAINVSFRTANMGLALQYITGYPVIALIVSYLILRKMPPSGQIDGEKHDGP